MQLVPHSARTRRHDQDTGARVQELLARKKSEKQRLEREIEALRPALTAMITRRDDILALRRRTIERIEEASRLEWLSRRQVREIRSIVEVLKQQLALDDYELDEREFERSDEEPCSCPYCTGAQHAQSRFGGSEGPGATGQTEEARVESADKPRRERDLRNLYRDLALRFHPDRAADETSRKHHEAMMREVNEAYHGGDTDRLLRMSHELGLDIEHVRGADGVILELYRQYEVVKAEVRELRSSPLGELVVQGRRAERRGLSTPLQQMQEELDEAHAAADRMLQFAMEFLAGRISVDVFIAGPAIDGDGDGGDIELADAAELEAMIFTIVRGMVSSARGQRQGPSRSRRGKRKRGRR